MLLQPQQMNQRRVAPRLAEYAVDVRGWARHERLQSLLVHEHVERVAEPDHAQRRVELTGAWLQGLKIPENFSTGTTLDFLLKNFSRKFLKIS